MRRRLAIAWVLCALATVAPPSVEAQAQARMATAKGLYADADYDGALAELAAVASSGDASAVTYEVHHYRALCLVALGRTEEAERAMAATVEANPAFVPAASDVSPRVAGLFNEVRDRLLPQLARKRLAEARGVARDGEPGRALAAIDAAMALLNDDALASRADLDDLRLAAGTMRELAVAQVASAAKAPAAAAPATAPAPAPLPESAITSVPTLSAAVAIRQNMPRWNPQDEQARRARTGAVRVLIDATGAVTGATMERPVHPAFDRLLIEATRTWRYRPALRDGRPIPSESVVLINLEPGRN